MRIEVVLALPETQDVVMLEIAHGASAQDAVVASGILERHPGLAAGQLRLGVFGRQVRPDRALRDGDRVEILRPLAADPKEARRRRARRR